MTAPVPGSSRNARLLAAAVGGLTLVLGLLGLLYPDRMLGWLGFAILSPSDAAGGLGEIRATYGGLFVVLGALTLLAALDPPMHRDRLLLVALLWLGVAGGRFLGVVVDGNPGLFGWIYLAVEVVMGGALIAAWFTASEY